MNARDNFHRIMHTKCHPGWFSYFVSFSSSVFTALSHHRHVSGDEAEDALNREVTHHAAA